jgi:hypothetical protein
MNLRVLIFVCFIALRPFAPHCFAQSIQLNPPNIDFGLVEQAGSLKAEVIVSNTGNQRLFLMRAETEPNFEVFVSKKTLQPGDTALLRITYRPKLPGSFSSTLRILHNQSEKPLAVSVNGRINSLLPDILTNCVSFSPKTNVTTQLIKDRAAFNANFIDARTGEKVNEASILFVSKTSNRKQEFTTANSLLQVDLPLGPYALIVSAPGYETQTTDLNMSLLLANRTFALIPNPPKPAPIRDSVLVVDPVSPPSSTETLDPALYKPNHIVFLIDLSGSMKAPNKLPLLKTAIAQMLKPIRPIDKISIVTYAETVRVLLPPTTGADKTAILRQLDSLQAGGLTAGSEGLERAYTLASESWIDGGNNQVILATDGVFRLNKADRKRVARAGQEKTPILSVAAFGNDLKALQMLETLSRDGQGSFLKIDAGDDASEILLNEIRKRSRM